MGQLTGRPEGISNQPKFHSLGWPMWAMWGQSASFHSKGGCWSCDGPLCAWQRPSLTWARHTPHTHTRSVQSHDTTRHDTRASAAYQSLGSDLGIDAAERGADQVGVGRVVALGHQVEARRDLVARVACVRACACVRTQPSAFLRMYRVVSCRAVCECRVSCRVVLGGEP